MLTKEHIQKRCDWAREIQTKNEEWFQTVFSDEKKFNLEGPDSFRYYWHDFRKEPKYLSKRVQGGGNVMVWGAFNSLGNTNLAFISNRMHSQDYQDVLEMHLKPPLNLFQDTKVIFQQDNASIHVSNSSKTWFQRENIALLPLPAKSPDLNPIENVCGSVVREVYKDRKQYATVNELKDGILTTWENLDVNYFFHLINSIKKRVYHLIEAGGKYIGYKLVLFYLVS